VGHFIGGVVSSREFDSVSLAHPDETSGHRSAERPEYVIHALGNLHFFFDDFEFHDDLGAIIAVDWWAARWAGWSGPGVYPFQYDFQLHVLHPMWNKEGRSGIYVMKTVRAGY
jgi:hypothetical protein